MVMHGRHAASHPRALRVPQLVLSGVPPVSSMSQRASDSTDTAPLWSNEDQRACSTPGADGDVDDWTASPTATAACFCCTVVVVMGFFMLGMMKNGMGGVLLLLSVLPGMAILFFAYWWQQYHTVKFPMVAWTYFGGIVGALPVAVVEWIIMASVFVPVGHTDVPADTHPLATRLVVAFFMAFIVASLVEECFKFFIVYTAVHFTRVRMAYGVVVLGLAGALGFATLENAAYVVRAVACCVHSTHAGAHVPMRAWLLCSWVHPPLRRQRRASRSPCSAPSWPCRCMQRRVQ